MSALAGFVLKVALISSSGALAPGPLTAAAAASGVREGWRGGFWISVGHLVVELPLVLLIGFGVASVLTRAEVARTLAFIGGIFLLFFSYLTARDALKVKSIEASKLSASPFFIGVALSALNPFFIAWWAGVGSSLVMEAVTMWGFAGIGILYASHIWLDFFWLTGLARVTSLSGFSMRIYRALLFFLALLVAVFAVDFLHYAVFCTHLLPF
ncbi:MAG: hypothetical protein PWR13_762 [Archaeoglobi archaeon]|nr:LysE family transporter [Candidatus Mnemosynella bozhongmuii]MDI3502516.1 hypothetical protein [Archaeoglobi archaeon]MDK2781734.1 hypothetical protein [Archaeoglobi archaeon]